jgi:hypothetical protein
MHLTAAQQRILHRLHDTVAIPADSMISFKVANNSVTRDASVTWIATS